jgi:hypothetical protein
MLGQPISRNDINEDVKKYAEGQTEILPLLNQLTAATKKFYGAEEISFVFEKRDLDQLYEQNPSADALRVYYGRRADGTPTVILVAARLFETSGGSMGAINLIASDANAGFQWPTGKAMQTPNPANFDILTDNG